MASTHSNYYVPEHSVWPIVGAMALFLLALGLANTVQIISGSKSDATWAYLFMFSGITVLLLMLYGWFSNVIHESLDGLYSAQMDRSFRMGMGWFIFSEVMFFAAFFGALFYVRHLAVPWLGGAGDGAETHAVLWPEFQASWPLLQTPNGQIQTQAMSPWGLPLMNTAILLTSAVSLTWAHFALKRNDLANAMTGLCITLLLGVVFLGCQAYEYIHAYHGLGLTLASGVYGNTFFILTGFHGLHVLIGATLLLAILIRCYQGHFNAQHHFAFEAAAWYWHFVDYVWLLLFVFVYCL